ncbi:PDGLE domain-containing protein [Methanothrix sp.]|jgi:hypothetical protein|uniref:PDGLE domain-containing protein n=2 Tax=Methanotrichaceae TaxID=143067 RepID=UPI0025806740|nr:PDGLE domain-containing protein [Methanothrix sp.]
MIMDRTIKMMIGALAVLIVLVPLGLLATGETFGEWGAEEVKEKLGYVPRGIESLGSLWSAPIPDYSFPGAETFTESALAYIASAIIGVVVCAGLLYIIGKKLTAGRSD